MDEKRRVLVSRKEIKQSGGVRAAVEEALSLGVLGMTPRAMTAYEATGMTPTEADGAGFVVIVEVESEEELREAVGAGADGVRLLGVGEGKARRLREIARELACEISAG
jgi:hypothetical protein